MKRIAAATALGAALAAPLPAQAIGANVFLWPGDEKPGTIVIHTAERRLYFVTGEGEAISYRVAVGKAGSQWTGRTLVTHKAVDPTWRPTPSMRMADRRLPEAVPPGPRNPLGPRAIYLAQGALRIHGTLAPSSIGKAASHGCFRMHNQDVVELYELVAPGSEVVVKD